MAERPDKPDSRRDLEEAIAWAAGFFGVAVHIDFGLDEGQVAMLHQIVHRLDQIESELLDA